MARLKLVVNVLYLSLSVILICASAEESGSANGTATGTTTTVPVPSSSSTTTTSTTTSVPVTTTTEAIKKAPTILKESLPTTTTTSTTLSPVPSAPVIRVEVPPTLSDFIIEMMKKFGAAKAAEAFLSLDQLPLGLIMKILLVEMDQQLAVDIVAMQRYAQSQDKALIQMIGRIVAGDKNVPKEIFTMDQKLMKFPWWMRIRQRMFNNLEKYVAAYSLVPVAAKSAIGGGGTSSSAKSYNSGLESLIQGPQPDLAIAVAASATESYSSVGSTSASASKISQQVPDNSPAASAPAPTAEAAPIQLSLLTPIQQQQILESLALAQAASGNNAQVQQLLQLQQLQQQQQQLQQLQQQQQQQQQQATNVNPLLQLLGLG